ncbi:MAG: Fic family protein [Desulfobacteraceae bacterium]|nr:Fic family protein [Desulfobacteraceae bacterium]
MSDFSLYPALPAVRLGELKDAAQEVIVSSATLEGRIAPETAKALGDRLRFLNSYYSNLIEGHKTSVVDIEAALNKKFSQDSEKRYAQQLCAAHVETERRLMREIVSDPPENICSFDYVSRIHSSFYEMLPQEHLFTHSGGGFTGYRVMPGKMRDAEVSMDGGRTPHGPGPGGLEEKYREFELLYHQENFHGDEKLLAAAASHHRLTWLHPFRDGNGRVARLFSGLYMALAGINRGNLWSLSRGFSRNKQWYMTNLQSADSPNSEKTGFDQAFFADFCMFFLETCLDQVRFMERVLALDRIDTRIDMYMKDRQEPMGSLASLDSRAGRLLKALFFRGEIPRGEAGPIMDMGHQSRRNARRIVSRLIAEGLVHSDSHRAPLRIGFPAHVLRYYFPELFDPSVMGEEGGAFS